jgi:ribosomal protein S18 acetylase RimI-like enzyme
VIKDVAIRTARESDSRRISSIVYGDPPAESVWLVGNRRKATALGKAMAAINDEMNWRNTAVAELDGRVVGIMQPGLGLEGGADIGLALAWHTLRIVGPFGIPEILRRKRVRERLNFTRPENSYHVAELHVDRSMRGQGIGGKLLDYAEAQARAAGQPRMSLVTAIENPARRLYERHGFAVVETKTDAEFLAGSGSEGRVLMVKELSSTP